MSDPTKNLDPAFQGIGQKIGIEIWRIENLQPVLLPKSDYGKFYSCDSYIILQTSSGRGGSYVYDIHYWIGKDTTQDEAVTAGNKTIELDSVLGGHAIEHRELQGFESDKFLSYFKPCIIPLEGGVSSGLKKVEEEKFDTCLYVCKGKRFARLKQVTFARSSLNHDDIFILDTKDKIYQFNGANSNIQERAKALEVIQHLKDNYHEGKRDVSIIDDGKLAAESDSGDFWVIFGGFAPIGRKTTTDDDVPLEKHPGKLYSIVGAQLKSKEGVLSKSMLENDKCYLLDCWAEVYVWFGRVTQVEERKAASEATELFINDQKRPNSTFLTRVVQGYETRSFKSNFNSWPMSTGVSSGDEGRGKVAALLKWKGVDVKSTSKSSPVIDEIPILIENGGKIEVWRINGSAKTPVASEEIGKFYSGDCYVVLYTYHYGDKKDNYFLSLWIGKDSTLGDREMADRLTNTMYNSLKGRPLQGRIFQGKEPPQFIALFQPMVLLKGGISSGYKKSIAEMNLPDETYTSDGIALIQISNTSMHNNKAVQVDAVATSLSSTNCFLLQSPSSFFIWNGNSSTFEQQQLAKKIAEFLKPGVGSKHVKEGKEISSFWSHLAGKQSYSSKESEHETTKDPHLFTYSLINGKFEVLEVFNFSQDDLLTEDILILDTHAEVFVWVGHSVNSKEKQIAFDIGQKYIDLSASFDGLSPHVPLYKITEGNEPCFFTSYFSWDTRKATVYGDSYAKKLSLLFGTATNHATESPTKSNGTNHSGPTQRASALAALSSAFKSTSSPRSIPSKPVRAGQGSQRAAAVAALSNVLMAEQKKASEASSPQSKKNNSPASEKQATEPSSPPLKMNSSTIPGETKLEDSNNKAEDHPEALTKLETTEELEPVQRNDNAILEMSLVKSQSEGENNFSYNQLTTKSTNPANGINHNERESYLSDDEFSTVMGMTKVAFYKQPKWKQDMQKRKVDLF